jgi:RNA polymerase sigma-70 factor (ECF subfamily)
MRDRAVDRLFGRFREHGDVRALGDVFDATSDELLRVATSLTRNLPEAEDLLQATFVTAIERARHWDREQRLVPWLCGILVRHAHERRRERTRDRDFDAQRLERTPERSPLAASSDAEFAGALERALESLEGSDREVLVAYLREGKEPIEIARERSLAPGTARMRVHRGLERLRKALPAGFALGAGAALAGRGLAAVKADVLREANAAAAAVAGATSAPTTAASGGLGAKALAAVALLALVLAGVAWWWTSRASPAAAAIVASATDGAAQQAELAHDSTSPPNARANVDRAPNTDDRAPVVAEQVHRVQRCGVTGRIVEANGAPASGVEVALHEFQTSAFALEESEAFGKHADPTLECSRVRTNADGRFALDGARPAAYHALAVERSACFLVAAALDPEQPTELGDFVLPPSGTIVGRVVDENGAPLAGVRMRAGALERRIGNAGFERVRAGTLGVVDESGDCTPFAIPAWLADVLERLPIALATSGEDGSFRLERVAAGSVTLFADAPGRVSTRSDELALEARTTVDVGALALSRGTTVRLTVVDGAGVATTAADVRIGSERVIDPAWPEIRIGWLERAREVAAGEYELAGIDPGDEVVAAVRRASPSGWRFVHGAAGSTTLQVELPSARDIRVEVVDENARAIAGAELVVNANSALETQPLFARLTTGPLALRTDGGGRANLAALGFGDYRVSCRAPGFAVQQTTRRVDADTTTWRVQLAAAQNRELRVIDARTGAAVEGADVRQVTKSGGFVVTRATTDRDGRARLASTAGSTPTDCTLRIEHPAYGSVVKKLANDESEIRLEEPGSLVFTAPAGTRGVVLVHADPGHDGLSDEPFVCRLDEQGHALLPRLAPGGYSVSLRRGVPKEIGARFLSELAFDTEELQRTKTSVRAGERTEVRLLASASAVPEGGACVVFGRITVNGAPAGGLDVRVRSELLERRSTLDDESYGESLSPTCDGLERRTTTDADGNYRIDGLVPGAFVLLVERRNGPSESGTSDECAGDVLCAANGALAPPETCLDFVCASKTARVLVVDPTDAPVASAAVAIQFGGVGSSGGNNAVRTDATGVARIEVPIGRTFDLVAEHPGIGRAREAFELRDSGSAPLEIRLRLASCAPCRGRITILGIVPESRDVELVFLDPNTERRVATEIVRLDAFGTGRFELSTLPPARYRVLASIDGSSLTTRDLDHSKGGEGDVRLVFHATD